MVEGDQKADLVPGALGLLWECDHLSFCPSLMGRSSPLICIAPGQEVRVRQKDLKASWDTQQDPAPPEAQAEF